MDKLDHGKKSWTPESCFKSQHYAPSYTSDQECEYSDCICCILECCILLPFLVVIATRNHVKQANSIIALPISSTKHPTVSGSVPGRSGSPGSHSVSPPSCESASSLRRSCRKKNTDQWRTGTHTIILYHIHDNV